MADWVDRTLTMHTGTAHTLVLYAHSLRYIDLWHRSRYGTPLSLANLPPTPVDAEILGTFFDDHLAIAEERSLRMRMPSEIFNRLREAGYNARIDCVSPRTSEFRLYALKAAHRLLNLYQQLDHQLIRMRTAELYAAWEAERAALGISITVPMSAANAVSALLGVCGEDPVGTMDTALVLMLCRLTSHQVADLRFSDLTPGTMIQDGEEIDVVLLQIRNPVNPTQRVFPRVEFIGAEAALIKVWGALRHERIRSPDDRFFTRETRANINPDLNHVWIGRRINLLARKAGLANASGHAQISPQWLRKAFEREWREQSPLVQVARAARITTQSAERLVRNRES